MGLFDTAGKILGTVGAVGNVISSNPTLSRLFGAGLSKGAEANDKLRASARFSTRNGQTDYRVRVVLPPKSDLWNVFFGVYKETVESGEGRATNNILEPLGNAGGVIFPLTPSIIIQHSASYTPLNMPHSNYPHYAYGHSEVPSFTVAGEFPVQNQEDARYWVAMLHFFRSVTKMFFGGEENDPLKGNPPPILHLSGYGDYVFNNIPVVVTNFNVDLRADVDYICTSQSARSRSDIDPRVVLNTDQNKTWAPTLSTVTLQLQPIYSRDSVKKFSMKDFVNGRLIGKDERGIGYI